MFNKIIFKPILLITIISYVQLSYATDFECPSNGRVRILAVDGGSVRGVVPTLALAKVEEIFQLKTAHLFDLFAGTSAGGLIVMGLLTPNEEGDAKYSAQDIANLFIKRSKDIFEGSPLRRYSTLIGITPKLYSWQGFLNVTHDYFGDLRFSELLKAALIISYHPQSKTGLHIVKGELFDKERLTTIAQATAAAPVYFPPAHLKKVGAVIDGGVYKNNSAFAAYLMAKKKCMEHRIDVVSLGTGHSIKHAYTQEELEQKRALPMVASLINELMENSSNAEMRSLADTMEIISNFNSVFGNEPDRFIRLNPEFKGPLPDIDDHSDLTLRQLIAVAKKQIEGPEFLELIKFLSEGDIPEVNHDDKFYPVIPSNKITILEPQDF